MVTVGFPLAPDQIATVSGGSVLMVCNGDTGRKRISSGDDYLLRLPRAELA